MWVHVYAREPYLLICLFIYLEAYLETLLFYKVKSLLLQQPSGQPGTRSVDQAGFEQIPTHYVGKAKPELDLYAFL